MLRQLDHSPVTEHQFLGQTFFLKRDDLLHPLFSGNKARKFSSLLTQDFSKIDTLVGYGSAQANSLYSLAALAYLKQVPLEFYVQHIPVWLKQNPIGNYRAALDLGADVIDLSNPQINPQSLHPQQYIEQYCQPHANTLCIPEGGRSPIAREGIEQLGHELLEWINENAVIAPVIALPSGTGTTALYLQQFFKPYNIEVLTCACVGGKSYLIKQFEELHGSDYPTILPSREKHHFGKLYLQDYEIWQQLKIETGIEFDLLYDPLMWHSLLPWIKNHPHNTLIYIHQGGLLGNKSMTRRYERKLANQYLSKGRQ